MRILLHRLNLATLVATMLFGIEVHAETYYVDFESGKDSNSGHRPSAAWKRCPGDPLAAEIARSVVLLPGDTVLFRGGVSYFGNISVNASGTMDMPITFKGDGWGAKKALLEGADRWQSNWTECPSMEFAKGNPHFERIYYSTAPADYSSFQAGVYEDGEFLWYSQGPDVSDPFYYDNNHEYYPIEQNRGQVRQTRNSITDTNRFNQTVTGFWVGAHVATWTKGNLVTVKPVIRFDPASQTVYHGELEADAYTDRTSYYSMLNHVSLISRPGEFAHDPTNSRVYVWPRNSDSANVHEYSLQVRETAFSLTNRSYITIDGFSVRHFAQAVHASSTSAVGVVVRNNDISTLRSANKYAIFVNAENSLVEGNRVIDCQRAVGILSSATGIVIRNNFVSRTSRQGIWLMGAKRSQIVNNIIADIQGSHANALSIYSDSSDILVANNSISLSSSPITYEASSNLTFYGNVVDGGGRNHAAADWFGTTGRIAFINNTFVRHPTSPCILVHKSGGADYLILNNILDGDGPSSSQHDYNLFVRSPEWTLAPHEALKIEFSDIFVASDVSDWRMKKECQVGFGTDPIPFLPTKMFPEFDFKVDRQGNSRVPNMAWDIGAFQRQP